jgi:uncharacterized cupredoxin-like copper-binding protein
MKRGIGYLTALAFGAAVVAFGYGVDANGASASALGPGLVDVTIDVHYSKFEPRHLRVHQGTLVRFTIQNHDPIRHEFIVGPPEVHARHEHGTEAEHPPVPGETSIDPNDSAGTVYLFDTPGVIRFECHLPGHVAYGMTGDVTVVAN